MATNASINVTCEARALSLCGWGTNFKGKGGTKMIATVKYQVATYSGEVQVNCNEYDEDEYIIAKAKRIVTQRVGGSLPFGYESWKVVGRS